jgi:hypothetical protein
LDGSWDVTGQDSNIEVSNDSNIEISNDALGFRGIEDWKGELTHSDSLSSRKTGYAVSLYICIYMYIYILGERKTGYAVSLTKEEKEGKGLYEGICIYIYIYMYI